MQEPIKDWRGKVIGFVEEDHIGNKVIRDYQGRVLGKYNKSLNVTQDFHGHQVAKGDCVMMLLK